MRSASKTRSVTKRGLSDAGTDPEVGLHQAGKGYIKPGNGGGHYAEYIATREGVELIEAPSPSHDGGGYLEYMAQRPRSHGLFSADGPADLEKTMEEINGHTGPVWTFV